MGHLSYIKIIIFIYNLDTNTWSKKVSLRIIDRILLDNAQFIYKDTLYMVMGYKEENGMPNRSIFKIDLSNNNYETQKISISNRVYQIGRSDLNAEIILSFCLVVDH